MAAAQAETDAANAKIAVLEKAKGALERELKDLESSLGSTDAAKVFHSWFFFVFFFLLYIYSELISFFSQANLEKYRKELESNLEDASDKLDECTKARANLDRDLKKVF